MQNVTGVTTNTPIPADGDDYTFHPIPPKSTTSVVMNVTNKGRAYPFLVENVSDNVDWNDTDTPLTYAALVRTVYRLQDEVHGLAAQVVELRERMEKWTADS